MEKHIKQLQQYLGTQGCKAGLLDYDGLIETAKLTFDVPGRTIGEVAYAVAKLGAQERTARAREAIRKHWPTPNALWPSNGNARKKLAKEIRP